MRKVTIQVEVLSALPEKKVAKLIDRMIAIGQSDAIESLDEEHHPDTELAASLNIKKAKALKESNTFSLLKEAAEALDVLSEDAEEAGYPQRAESATELAMRCRECAKGK